jgi:monoamine oxidase
VARRSNSSAHVDIAIVGGGVAGLYSAWRLKEAHPRKTIVVYESDDRTGGRLLTAIPPEAEHLRAELGGMRYLSTHRIVHALATKVLKLDVQPFPVSVAQNIAYLRGFHFQRQNLDQDLPLPYRLAESERRKTIGAMMGAALEAIVPGILGMKPEDRLKKTYDSSYPARDGRPLWQWGFWNVLFRVMSAEAYQFVVDASGYDTTVSNWNAADAIPWFLADFGADVKYLYPREGMQAFPDGIRKRFADLGGTILPKHTVKRIAKGRATIQLEFDGKAAPVEADDVVLAMPRRALELIDLRSLFGDKHQRVTGLIESVAPQPLFKLFACYPWPWWTKLLALKQGQTTTDIPIRQTYYFGTEGEQPGADPENENSLLMATYDDGRNIKYWIGFLREDKAKPYPGGGGSSEWERNRAPETLVDEVHRLLAEVHGVPLDRIPKPYAAAYRDWGLDPYGGGYNLWKIHAKSIDIAPAIVAPVEGLRAYICGEAYSHDQGWVEGALETAEDMLKRCFKLKEPNWLHGEKQAASGDASSGESATLRY